MKQRYTGYTIHQPLNYMAGRKQKAMATEWPEITSLTVLNLHQKYDMLGGGKALMLNTSYPCFLPCKVKCFRIL